jgi:hypothetical protein
MKNGVLRKNTKIHTIGNISLSFPKGTKVFIQGGVLRFNPAEDVEIVRAEGGYYAVLWDSVYRIYFPKGGSVPYPLSML